MPSSLLHKLSSLTDLQRAALLALRNGYGMVGLTKRYGARSVEVALRDLALYGFTVLKPAGWSLVHDLSLVEF